MVQQGSKDPRVLQVESDEMVAEIKKNNVPVEYVLFEDEGHGFVKKEMTDTHPNLRVEMAPGAYGTQQRTILETRMGNMVVAMERTWVGAQDKQTEYHTCMIMAAAYPGISLLMMQEDYAVVQRNSLEMMLWVSW